jgi:hypothetical protein
LYFFIDQGQKEIYCRMMKLADMPSYLGGEGSG